MSTEYSACLLVGLPASHFVTEKVVEKQKPVYNRNSGVQEGTEPDNEYHYFVAGKEIENVFETMFENGLQLARVAAIEEDVWGIVVKCTGDQHEEEDAYVELDPFDILKAKEEAEKIFDEMGVETSPKMYLILCGS